MSGDSAPVAYVACFSGEFAACAQRLLPGAAVREVPTYRRSQTYNDVEQFVVDDFDNGALAEKVEVLFANLPVIVKYRHRLPNLRWAHSTANGLDPWFENVAPEEPPPMFTLTKTSGRVNAAWIAEYVLAHVLTRQHTTCVVESYEAQKEKKWNCSGMERHGALSNSTIALLGVGAIARGVAKRCKAVGMTVWGLTRHEVSWETRCPDVDVYRTTEDLPEVLENCDYICSILPSTPATRGLLSGDVLSHCQHKKGVLINVGRGDVVDEASIVRAIKSGWIGGAVLDVFPEEPLPESSPLWSLPGVTITPHISGWSMDPSYMQDMTQCFADNYYRYVEGQPLQNVVDFKQGY